LGLEQPLLLKNAVGCKFWYLLMPNVPYELVWNLICSTLIEGRPRSLCEQHGEQCITCRRAKTCLGSAQRAQRTAGTQEGQSALAGWIGLWIEQRTSSYSYRYPTRGLWRSTVQLYVRTVYNCTYVRRSYGTAVAYEDLQQLYDHGLYTTALGAGIPTAVRVWAIYSVVRTRSS
jgi:hypothetical protein